MPRPPRRRPPNVGLQAARLRHEYPEGTTRLGKGRLLTWCGPLQPTDLSARYDVLLAYNPDLYRLGVDPVVYVVTPRLKAWQGYPLPHVYPHNRLCLYLGDQWHPDLMLAETLLPWATTWLFFYEVWLTTGEWHGEGEHPDDQEAPPARRSVRRGVSSMDAVRTPERASSPADPHLDLLTAGLRQAYGRDADLTQLLRNAGEPISA
jgi:hypothetical protein